MKSLTFWKTITNDKSEFLERLIEVLQTAGIQFCVIGGQAVNAYVEPLVSLDLDLVVAIEQLEEVEQLLGKVFTVQHFPYSLNVYAKESDLRVQIQTDARYFPFVERAQIKNVLGLTLPVASIGDLLAGKIWAFQDTERRASKRQKDLTDIARIVERYPEYEYKIPQEIREHLL